MGKLLREEVKKTLQMASNVWAAGNCIRAAKRLWSNPIDQKVHRFWPSNSPERTL
jgi:hypothetical protein